MYTYTDDSDRRSGACVRVERRAQFAYQDWLDGKFEVQKGHHGDPHQGLFQKGLYLLQLMIKVGRLLGGVTLWVFPPT